MPNIIYSQAFARNVKAELRARFRPDSQGIPLHVADEEGLLHYTIELSLYSPSAREIDSVIYRLDDTYADPIAASNDRDNDFTEVISSYGDFEIDFSVQMGRHEYKQRAWLSSLLEEGHEGEDSPSIRDAIKYIQKH